MSAPIPASRPKPWLSVAPELTLVLWADEMTEIPYPADPMVFSYQLDKRGRRPRLQIHDGRIPEGLDTAHGDQLLLVVSRAAYRRIGGERNPANDGDILHLPSALQLIVVALLENRTLGEAGRLYRVAKTLELMTETIRLDGNGELLLMARQGTLSHADTERVMQARRLIDERWHEQLTLSMIARTCGLNRAKLTTAFRELFECTIREALLMKRLDEARNMLATTDLPVATIGLRNGYLNLAAFSRAFHRRFGVAPRQFRKRARN